MSTTIKLANKDFNENLRVTFDGETKELSDEKKEIKFDSSNNGKHTLEVEFVNTDILNFSRLKKPVARFFLRLLMFFFIPIMHIMGNDDFKGGQIYTWLTYIQPFEFKKKYIVETQGDKAIKLKFSNAKYKYKIKEYTMPSLEISDCEYTVESENVKIQSEYVRETYKTFNTSLYVFLGVLFAFIFGVFGLVTRGMIIDAVNRTAQENLFGIIAMTFCFAVLIFLVVMAVVSAVRSHRLCNEICEKYEG